MKFCVLIPARYGSSRLPGKPLLMLDGIPMVVRTAQQALQSLATTVVVATDDERIAQVCRSQHIDVVMTQIDHATGTDRLVEAVNLLKLSPDDIVVNVQGDEPHLPPECINQVAQLLTEHPKASMSTLAHPIDRLEEFQNPNIVKVVLGVKGEALYFSRAMIPYPRDAFAPSKQNLPKQLPTNLPVLRHIGLYAYRTHFLQAYPALTASPLEQFESLEQLRALANGHRIQVGIVPKALPPGIDTPEDYQLYQRSHT